MTDRIALIVSRLATIRDRKIISSFHIMGDIRVTLNIIVLREYDRHARDNHIDSRSVMEALSRHFYLKLKQPLSSDDTLLYRLDRCICQTSALPRSREKYRLLSALVRLRSDLFPQKPFQDKLSFQKLHVNTGRCFP